MSQDWTSLPASLREQMDAHHQARERALSGSRAIIQFASKAIRHVHRHQFEESAAILEQARAKAREVRAQLADFPTLLYAGYLQDAEKEVVEAAAVLAIAKREPLPSREALGVDLTSYLNGLGEAASEMRRYVLDEMRKQNTAEAERLLAWMEAVYDELITFDYPDGATGGLRRTCDALRAVVERTRSDLTLTTTQQELLQELQLHRSRRPE